MLEIIASKERVRFVVEVKINWTFGSVKKC